VQRRRDAAKQRQETAPLRRRISGIEDRVAALQAEIARIDGKLASPTLYADAPAEAVALSKARSDAIRAMAVAEDEWLALTTELEALTAST